MDIYVCMCLSISFFSIYIYININAYCYFPLLSTTSRRMNSMLEAFANSSAGGYRPIVYVLSVFRRPTLLSASTAVSHLRARPEEGSREREKGCARVTALSARGDRKSRRSRRLRPSYLKSIGNAF